MWFYLDDHVYVGIDFSKLRTDFAILNAQGKPIEKHQAFANSRVGYQEAKAWLMQRLRERNVQAVDLIGEATSYYWLPMFIEFSHDPEWAAYTLEQFLVNPRFVHWHKKSQPPTHKDDTLDPSAIADYVRTHRPNHSWSFEPRWLPLRIYTRLRFHLTCSLTREKNLFDLYLFLAYSCYASQHPFSHNLGKTSQELLSQPQRMAQLAQLPVADLAEELEELSGHRLPHSLESARRLQKALLESYPVHPDLSAALQNSLEVMMQTCNDLQMRIQQLDDLIARLVQNGYPEVAWLDSIPGIGPVFSSGIAAEIGDLQRFSQVLIWDKKHKCDRLRNSQELTDAVAKYAGLWWQRNASGQFVGEDLSLNRQGNSYLRYFILEAADCMRRYIPSFAAYYQKKHEQSLRHKHKRALVLTGCKALELFVALLRQQEPYRAREVKPTLH